MPRGRQALAATLLATMVASAAAEPPPAPPPRELGEVLVEGAPVDTPAAAPADVTAFATVIDTSEAPTRVETLDDALGAAPGVQVRRYGGLGAFSTVSVRGFSPGQVRVYLDGVPLARADDESVNLGDLPIDAVERVEVYRGTTPLRFAASGPGGVVNVVTRRPGATPLAAASASWGSFETRKVDLAAGATRGTVDGLVFGSYLGSANDFTYRDDLGTEDNPADDRTVRRRNAGFDQGDLLARVGWRPAPPLRLALTSDTFVKSQGVPGRGSVQSRDAHRTLVRQLAQLDGGWTLAGALPLDLDANAWMLWQRQHFEATLQDRVFPPTDHTDETLGTGGQVVARTAFGRHHVPGALLAVAEDVLDGDDALGRLPGPAPTRTRFHLTLGAEDEIVLFDERISVVPGVRWELFDDDFPSDPRDPSPPRARTSRRDFVSPRIGVRATPYEAVTLLANLGRYTREPNLLELFGNSGTVAGNPDLRAETSTNWDAGFRLALPPVGGVLRDVTFEYAYFHAQVDDLIVLVPSSVNVFTPQNVASARLAGHEVTSAGRVGANVGVSGNYTHQDARQQSAIARFDDTRIPGRPADEVHLHVELDWSRAHPLPGLAWLWPGRIWYDLDFLADNFLDTANRQRVPSRTLHGVGVEVTLPWTERLRLALQVENLTDDQTRDVLDFPLPGRSLFATVSWGFGQPDLH